MKKTLKRYPLDHMHEAVAIVEAADGHVSAEARDLMTQVASGEKTHEEVTRRLIEKYRGG